MSQDNVAPAKIKPRKKSPRRITPDYLHNAGLAYLQRFAASSGHFRAVMMRKIDRSCRHHTDQDKDACAKQLESLIERYVSAGLLDDAGYTRGAVTSLRRRGLSARAIQFKLTAKGVGSDMIADAVEEHGEDDLMAALRLARRKRIGPFRVKPDDHPDKAMAAMARAGFGYDTARRALNMDPDEAQAILGESA